MKKRWMHLLLPVAALVLGIAFYSVVGLLITLCLFAETLWLSVVIKKEKE